MLDSPMLIELLRQDQDLLHILLLILHKRLIVIDDLEYQNLKTTKGVTPFLTLAQTKWVSEFLNKCSYRVH